MSKVIKSGKLDNVIASMDTGKHYIVKMRDGTVTAIEKIGLPEKIGMCLGNGCFIAGTLVTTRSGLKPIEEIVIGDYVLSRNEETGEDSYKKVTDTLVRSTQEICTIELENGNIKSTTGHLFMVKDKWWKAVVELVAGDVLVTSDGEDQIVKSIKVEEKGYPVTTYNLTVEDNHTFFVGSEKILTHNTTKLLKKCDYTKEISESITEEVSKNNKLLSTECNVGTYKYLRNRGKIGDNITPHHIPSKEYMKQYGVKMNDGVSINMEQPSPGSGGRHRLTKTYGRNMNDAQKQVYYNLSPREALFFDIKNLKKIYKEQGLYTSEVRKGLMDAIKLNKELYPELFKK